MTLFASLPLAWKFLLRDARAGELHVIMAAIIIAVAANTAVSLFTERMSNNMVSESADIMGADLTLKSTRKITGEWLDLAQEFDLKSTHTLEFASVVIHNEDLQLASIHAIEKDFPLRGKLRIQTNARSVEEETSLTPQQGKVWIERRLLNRLKINTGDSLTIGQQEFEVSKILTFEPGRVGNVFGVAPRVLLNYKDVISTGIIQPGSRLSYLYWFSGTQNNLETFSEQIRPLLKAGQSLAGVKDGGRALTNALDKAEQYLGLTVLVAALLAGVAIATSVQRYSTRHLDMSAILRCMGAQQKDILSLFIPQLIILGVFASSIGVFFGILAEQIILLIFSDIFKASASLPGYFPLINGWLTGMITLAGFGLPPLLRLKEVSPLRVLRRDLSPLPVSSLLVYTAALTALFIMMTRYTGRIEMSFLVLIAASAGIIIMMFSGRLILKVSAGIFRFLGHAPRLGINNLLRRTNENVKQILAFGLVLMAMAIIALIRTDLLTSWKAQLPDNTPNHFAINVLPQDTGKLSAYLAQRGFISEGIYPMVKGRLISINNESVKTAVSKEKNINALNRELNLTWLDKIQDNNKLISGKWWLKNTPDKNRVSVESRLAKQLGIVVGDQLGFDLAGQSLDVTVSSIRNVQWDSFQPNFYMVFPPGLLDSFPVTYITSFYLPPDKKELLIDLVQQFPSVTVLELDDIIAQVEQILSQVILAVEFVLLFVLLAGFTVLFAALQTSHDERLYEGALMRTLGASKKQIRTSQIAEFILLGLLSGLLAAFTAEILTGLLYTKVFNIEYSFKWPLWLITPFLGALLIGTAGYFGTRSVVRKSPALILRNL